MKDNAIRLLNFIMHNLLRILAGIFMLAGIFTISVNSGILMGFDYAYTLDDLNVNNLKSGMCVSDMLNYTYGHITSEYALTGSKEVYVVGMGGKKNQYILLKKNVSNTFTAFKTEYDKLPVVSMNSKQKPKSVNSTRIYGIVKRTDRDKFFFKFFEDSLKLSRLKLNSVVSTKYHIEIVTPDEIKHKIVTGIWEVIISGICIVYIIYRRKKKIRILVKEENILADKRKNKNLLYDYIKNIRNDVDISYIKINRNEYIEKIEDRKDIDSFIESINTWKIADRSVVKETDDCELTGYIEICFEDFNIIQIEILRDNFLRYMSQTYIYERTE